MKKQFPSVLSDEKPQFLSSAMQRLSEDGEDRCNEFFSNFFYSEVQGIGKEQGVTRRDPSKIIKVDGLYYVWYTSRRDGNMPVGVANCTDKLPATDWDLCDIYYATSQNGWEWQERGVAVARGVKGSYGDRSVATPDILCWGGKYYLYFQAYTGKYPHLKDKNVALAMRDIDGKGKVRSVSQDLCDVSVACADTPNGPWTTLGRPIIKRGDEEAWDGGAIHDPYPLVFNGKIHLYYKGQPLKRRENTIVRFQGLAIADNPMDCFKKVEQNPVINSGHETFLYPYRDGIAALATFDGFEKNTVQFAKDGINFNIKAHVRRPPEAGGPYLTDAFADNKDGRGVSWGLCHIRPNEGDTGLFIARFDCALSRDIDNVFLKDNGMHAREDAYLRSEWTLSEERKKQIIDLYSDKL